MYCIYTMEYYLAIKRNTIAPLAETWFPQFAFYSKAQTAEARPSLRFCFGSDWLRLSQLSTTRNTQTRRWRRSEPGLRTGVYRLPASPQRPLHVGWAPHSHAHHTGRCSLAVAAKAWAEGWNPGMERRAGWLLELTSHTGRTLVRRPPGPPAFFWYYSIFSLNFLYDLWLQSQILFSVIRRTSASGGADFQSWNGPGTSFFSLCGLVEPGRALQGSLMPTDSRLTHALRHGLG